MRSVLWIVVVASFSLAACGDGGSRGAGGDGGIGSGADATTPTGGFGNIDPDRSIDSLSDGEASAFCRDALAYAYAQIPRDEFHRFMCTFGSVLFSATPEACEDTVSACLTQAEPPEQECEFSAEARRGCDVSIGEYERCYRDMMTTLDALTPRVTCELAGDPSALQTLSPQNPASCESLRARCPTCARGTISGHRPDRV